MHGTMVPSVGSVTSLFHLYSQEAGLFVCPYPGWWCVCGSWDEAHLCRARPGPGSHMAQRARDRFPLRSVGSRAKEAGRTHSWQRRGS